MATTMQEVRQQEGLGGFDPFGDAFRADPDAAHPRLIAASPGRITMEGVPSVWCASYADCTTVMRDFKHWSSVKPKNLPGMERVDFMNGQPVMNYSDPPVQTRRRKVVNPAFTPKRTERIAEDCEKLISGLLDEAEARGTVDGMGELSKPMAVEMILGAFLGVAAENYYIFQDYVAAIPLLDRMRPGDAKPAPFLAAWDKGAEYCRRELDRTRREGGDSVLALIAGADSLSDDEMMAMMVVLFSGGTGTVAGAACASLYNMVRTPGMIERVRAEPDTAGKILEESMRMFPPVQLVMRFANNDAELGGQSFADETPMYVMIASACHDPAVFPDPDRFDPDRPNVKDHLALGFGMHTCIGNAITRRVTPILLRQAAERFPDIRLTDPAAEVAFETTPRSRHIKALPLTL